MRALVSDCVLAVAGGAPPQSLQGLARASNSWLPKEAPVATRPIIMTERRTAVYVREVIRHGRGKNDCPKGKKNAVDVEEADAAKSDPSEERPQGN